MLKDYYADYNSESVYNYDNFNLATPNIFTPKPNRGSGLVWLVTIRPIPIQIPAYTTEW